MTEKELDGLAELRTSMMKLSRWLIRVGFLLTMTISLPMFLWIYLGSFGLTVGLFVGAAYVYIQYGR